MATSDSPLQSFNAVDSLHHHRHHCHHHWFHHHHHHWFHHRHHHHHHHHPLFTIGPHCFPIQSFNFPNYHFYVNPPFAPIQIPLLPESTVNNVSKPSNGAVDLGGLEIKESGVAEKTQLLEEGFEEEVEEDDGEAVFVMTDEWVEFFAKSEAKRKLQKKLAKKNKKKSIE